MFSGWTGNGAGAPVKAKTGNSSAEKIRPESKYCLCKCFHKKVFNKYCALYLLENVITHTSYILARLGNRT
jgi:hypothetical protein